MIASSYFTLAILIMAAITFSVRYVFFIKVVDIKLHPTIKTLLKFTAPCVLTAMFIPIMFQDSINPVDNSALTSLLSSSYFWASMFAIVASVFIRQTLLVILLSMAVFYGLRFVL